MLSELYSIEEDEKIKIVQGFPIIYLEDIELLVVADLHLGIEQTLFSGSLISMEGIQFRRILKEINQALDKTQAKRILFLGDLKNTTSRILPQEKEEIISLWENLSQRKLEIIMLSGNHDSFLKSLWREITGEPPISKWFTEGRYFFSHGHLKIPLEQLKNYEWLIIAHEHPAITFLGSLGEREKFLATVIVDAHTADHSQQIKILIIPPLSIYAPGTDFPPAKLSFLSPILNSLSISEMIIYAIDRAPKSTGTYRVPFSSSTLKSWL
ncbi:MAG: metallophosphoesterase [Candidatus Kariarchaeaceae archaeon]